MNINDRVRDIVDAENISQEELAKKMGCTRQNINDKLLRGNMRAATMEKLLDAIGYEIVIRKKSS